MKANRGLWAGIALGSPVMAAGVLDALGTPDDTRPAQLLGWVIGLVLALDLVVVPVALGVGRLLRGSPPMMRL